MQLTKIELKTSAGKRIELSINEAKDLYNELNELFGTKYVPSTPIYIDRSQPWVHHNPYWYGDTLCNVETDSGLNISYSGIDK